MKLPNTMQAMVTIGHGDRDRMVFHENWPRHADDFLNKDKSGYFGSGADGGFAQHCMIPTRNALAVRSTLSGAERATFSCFYSTAKGMPTRAKVTAADTVPVPGASGGVGGARVIAKGHTGNIVVMP